MIETSYKSHYQNFTPPFEIPDSWEWVKLDEIATSNIGLTYSPQDIVEDGVPVYRSNNIKDNKICLDEIVSVSCHILEKQYLHNGDLLICARNGSRRLVGKNIIIENLEHPTSFGAFMAVCRSCYNPWIKLLLDSPYFNSYLDESNSTAINQITQKMLLNFVLPFPPQKEQSRIIAAFSSTECIIDSVEQRESELKTSITNLKFKILDLAMQGKLVPQDPTDEPAVEMLLRVNPKAKIITDNPHSWNVPANWAICKLGDTVKIRSAKRVMKADWRTDGVPFYRTREIVKLSENGTVENELFISDQLYDEYREKYGIPNVGDIMITAVGTIGKTYIVRDNDKFYYKDASVLCISPYSIVLSDFLTYLFKTGCLKKQLKGNSKGTTVDTITIEKANSYTIALPPLNEQKRIVVKIEELYSVLDEIEASLQS